MLSTLNIVQFSIVQAHKNNFYVNLSNSLRNQPKIYLHWTGRAFAAVDARRIFSSGMVKSE